MNYQVLECPQDNDAAYQKFFAVFYGDERVGPRYGSRRAAESRLAEILDGLKVAA